MARLIITATLILKKQQKKPFLPLKWLNLAQNAPIMLNITLYKKG